eukprot:11760646-Alexandrium_andersonii.AAC.1
MATALSASTRMLGSVMCSPEVRCPSTTDRPAAALGRRAARMAVLSARISLHATGPAWHP